MTYLIIQTALLLLIAALIGLVIGWFLRYLAAENDKKEWATKRNAMERELGETQKSLATEQKTSADLSDQVRDLKGKAAEADKAGKAKADLEAQLAECQEQAGKTDEMQAQLDDLGKQLTQAHAERDSARDAETDCKRAAEADTKRIKELEAEQDKLKAALATCQGDQTGLEAELKASEKRMGELEAELASLHAEQATAAVAAAATSAAAASAEPEAEAETAPELYDAPQEGQADDLKQIKGVGPKLEKLLNELGIYHFHQIAGFGPEQIAWVNARLKFKGRIEREKWIPQAQELAKKD